MNNNLTQETVSITELQELDNLKIHNCLSDLEKTNYRLQFITDYEPEILELYNKMKSEVSVSDISNISDISILGLATALATNVNLEFLRVLMKNKNNSILINGILNLFIDSVDIQETVSKYFKSLE